MELFHWRRWLRRQLDRARGTRSPRPRRAPRRPQLEALEDRLAPATLTWTGALGNNKNWGAAIQSPTGSGFSTNWTSSDGRVVAIPQTGDDLVFPAGAAQTFNTNDLTNLSVNSITFQASGYFVNGNAVTVTGSIADQASGGSNGLAVPLVLPNTTPIDVVQSSEVLSLGSAISGNGGITKEDSGALFLFGANSYSGPTQVDAGLVLVGTGGAGAKLPGALTIGTGSGPGAQVLLNADNATDPTMPVTVNSDGLFAVGEDGSDPALASFAGDSSSDTVASLTLNGGTVSIAASQFQGDTPASVLTLSGDVTTSAAAVTATIQGGGTLSLGGANRTFTVADGSADPDLLVSATIADGAPVTPPVAPGGTSAGGLTLTSGGAAEGFTLSTFASGFPTFPAGEGQNGGPFGVAFPGQDKVLVSDLNGDIYVFPSDTDNQTLSGATVGATYNSFDPLGMTQGGGKIYLGFQTSNQVAQISPTGTFLSTVASIPQPHGIAINPTTGDILVSSDSGSINGAGIWDVNPSTGAVRNIFSGMSFDGLATDGTTVYAARIDGEVVGFRISDGTQVFDAGNIPGADGVALGAGSLAGSLFVNTNFGELIQVNLTSLAQTLIASGGSRGDFVSVDPTNDTLLLTQSDLVARLIPPPGGGFAGGTSAGLAKAGAGRMVLSASNTYSGGTDVKAGELNVQSDTALGAGPATVETGAALELQAPAADSTLDIHNALTLNGDGVGGAGALDNVLGNNAVEGDITLAGDSAIGVDAGNPSLEDRVAGPGGLTKVGPGTLTVADPDSGAAANSYGGATLVAQGLLDLEKAGAVPGALTVGTGSAITTAQALLGVDAATSSTTAVTVNSDGLLAVGEDGSDLALASFAGVASSDTIAALALNGGTVSIAGPGQQSLPPIAILPPGPRVQSSTPASVLTLGGDVTADASSVTATVRGGGTLSLGGANRTFTVAGGGADPGLAVSAAIADGGASAGLNKEGVGRMELDATNSYTGTTQLDAGTLTLAAPSAVIGPLVVGDAPAVAQITVNGGTAATVPVTVNATGELDVGGPGISVSDTIGTLTLNGGTVNIAGPQLGGLIEPSVLELGGDVTTNDAAFIATIGGTGFLALGGSTRTFTVAASSATSAPYPDLLVSAVVISGPNGSQLAKAGAGRMVLSGDNGYNGADVLAGELNLQSDNALGPGDDINANVTVEAGAALEIQAPGTTPLTIRNGITLNGDGVGGTGALRNVAGDNVLDSNFFVLATDSSIGVDGGSLDFENQVGGSGGLTKVGTGNLTLDNPTFTAAANTYGGDTHVKQGLLVLAKAGAVPGALVVGTGAGTAAQVLLSADAATSATTTVTVNSDGLFAVGEDGSDPSPAGTFEGLSSNDTIASLTLDGGTVSIAGIQFEGSVPASVLTLGGDVTANASAVPASIQGAGTLSLGEATRTFTVTDGSADPDLTVSVAIADGGASAGLTKAGAGRMSLAHANSYTGTTEADAGTLSLDAAGAVVGPLVVGDAPAVVQINAAGATDASVPVTVNSTGELDVNADDAIGPLTLNGGTVNITGISVLTLGGDVAANASTATAVIEGTGLLSLGDLVRIFTVDGGGADPGLVVSAAVTDGPSGSELVKAGAGRMVLSGNSSYSGDTDITAGALNVQSDAALGAGDATVEAGAALEIQGPGAPPINITNALTLNGSGVGGAGALDNVSGNNAVQGDVTLASDSALGVDAGGLVLQDQVTGPGGLRKVGVGSLTLANPIGLAVANDYGGETDVDAGLLVLAKAGAVPGPLVVGTGTGTPAQVLLSADAATAPTTAVTVNGDGLFAVGEDGSDPALARFRGASSNDTIASLALNGGTVRIAGPVQQVLPPAAILPPGLLQGPQVPASVLTLGGDVTASAAAVAATIRGAGTLSLGGADRTFTVAGGGADPGLVVSATVADGVPVTSPVLPGGSSAGGLTLTAAGTTAGFSLSTFATGFPERSDFLGPLSVVFPASGGVLVDDDATGNLSRFPTDADGQDVASTPVSASYGFNQISGITRLGNTLYAATANGNTVVQLNDDGTLNRVVAGIVNADGITADPLSGRVFVSAFAGAIFEVDPVADTATVFANVEADGLSFDATSNTLYATGYDDPTFDGHILGFNATTGALVFDSGFIPGKPDGVAVGAGTLAGNLFVNTNAGTLVEINQATHAQTLLASGGSRGDFVSVDRTNGTVFVTQSDRLLRLIPPSGGGFLGGSPAGLTKAGTGRMVLGATNSYTGTTQVDAGTLTLAAPAAVIGPLVVGDAPALAQVAVANGTAPSVPVTVNATGEFDVNADDTIGPLTLNGGTVNIAAASTLTLGGDMTANAATVTATIGGSGTLSLGGAVRTFTLADGAADPDLAVSATVGDGAGNSELVKAGAGRMVLSSENAYGGGTHITAGELNVQDSGALGTGAATVEAGAALEVQAPGTTPLDIANALTLNGDGVNGTGALRNLSGANVWTGDITLANASAIGVDNTPFAPGAVTLTVQSDSSTLAAALGPGAPSGAVLSQLDTANTVGLPFLPADVGSFGTFTAVPPGAPSGTAVVNIPPGDGENGYFETTFTLPSLFSGISLTGSANVDDTGRVFLNGQPISPSIFSGDPQTLAESGDATFSTSDASLFRPGQNVLLISDGNRGGGPSGAAFFAAITYTPAGSSLTLADQVTGPGGLTKVGAGGLVLDAPASGPAANSYGGTTAVDAGLLVLAKAEAVPGPLTVGTGTGTPAQALLTADAATDPTTAVTVNSDGLLAVGEDGGDPALAGFAGSRSSDTVAALTLNGGTVSIAGPQQNGQVPASVLTLGGDVTATSGVIQGGGSLSLGGATRTFTVAVGLTVGVTVESGGTIAGLTKAGPGNLILAATNSYTGTTQVDAGTLTLAAPSAVVGPLAVGGGAVAVIAADNATAPTAPVTVNATGELDVGGQGVATQATIGPLTLNGGTVNIGGKDTVISTLTLGGDVTATVSAAPATIKGSGHLALGAANRTFTVAGGGADPGLVVSAAITDGGAGPSVVPGGSSSGSLTLTQDGMAAGFQLSTFADSFPTSGEGDTAPGPVGIAFPGGGKVLVSDFPGNVRVFPTDTDGQHASDVPASATYGSFDAIGIAQSGGAFYMTQVSSGNVIQINADGTFNQNIVSVPSALGIVTNPRNGHLFVASFGGTIFDVDPIAKTATVFASNVPSPDGLSIAPDGSVLYAAAEGAGGGGHVLGYRVSDGTLVFDSGDVGGQPDGLDGTALGSGSLAGNIFANTNDGRVIEINLRTMAQTLIASGGSRGDFVAVDPTSGTLLLTQSDRIARLIPPAGGGFGGGSGPAGLTKAGAGRLELDATNSYTGTTQVNAGTLTLAAPAAVNGPLVVGDAAADAPALAQITAANATNPAAPVPVTVNGSGELDVNADDTIGPLTLNGGTVNIAAASTVTLGGDVTAPASTSHIGGGGTLSLGNAPRALNVAAGAEVDVNTPVDGSAAATLTKSGPGTLALQTDNVYHGPTVVADGVLNVESPLALGDAAAGTTVEAGATLAVVSGPHVNGVANIPEPLTLSGPGFQGGAALVSTFVGNLFFPNSWSGPILLNADSAVEVDDPLTITGLISGPGGLIVRGGQLPLTLAAAGNNSYRGATVVDGGDLQLRQSGFALPGDLVIGTGDGKSSVCDVLADEQIPDGARVTIDADGVLGLNGQRETIGSLAGAGEVILNNSPSGSPGNGSPSPSRVGTLITGANNTSTTYAGTISGPGGSLVKIGSGVFILQGNNTYSGSTTINAGTLRVDGSQPSSAVIVNAGGTLGGSGTVGPTAVNPGGTVSPGDSPGVLTVQGGITFSPGSVLIAEINGPAAGTGYDQLKVSGRVVLNGATLRLALGFSPSPGQDFVVIVNNGSGPVSGTFAGLPEDAVLEHGTTFLDLSYAGGRGSDVDLRGLSRGDLFVRALFSDFNSPSSRTTRASFEQQVDGGAARLSVAQGFFVSPDRRLGEVLQFYQAFGQPLDGRQGVYMAELLRGVPAGQVLIEFLTSPAFRRLHRSNKAFVKALFTGLLGHPPGKHDLLGRHSFTYYLGQLTGGAVSRAGLVKLLLSSDEVYRAAVLQNYTTFLGLRPTAAQLQALTGQLVSGQLMPDTLSETIITQEAYIDFFVTRAGANQAPGVVLVNV